MKNINYYEELGVDYNNSGVTTLVYCMDIVEKVVRNIFSRIK